jgi:hypothetical protein
LRRPRPGPLNACPHLPGRRKRPLPTSTPLPPLRIERSVPKNLPLQAGVVWMGSGDALCCASPSSCSCVRLSPCQGDASVPSPHNPTPAPTGTESLPRRYHKIPTLWAVGSGCEGLDGRPSRPSPPPFIRPHPDGVTNTISLGLSMNFNTIMRIADHPARADQSAVGAINCAPT